MAEAKEKFVTSINNNNIDNKIENELTKNLQFNFFSSSKPGKES